MEEEDELVAAEAAEGVFAAQGGQQAAQSLGCVAVVADQALLDRALIEQLHDQGWRALAYTVNDEAVAHRLRDAGIDGLITDAVDQFPPTDTV